MEKTWKKRPWMNDSMHLLLKFRWCSILSCWFSGGLDSREILETPPRIWGFEAFFLSAPVFHNTWCRWSYLHYEVPLYLKHLYYSFDQFEAWGSYWIVSPGGCGFMKPPPSWSGDYLSMTRDFWAKVQFQPEKRPVILRWLARGSLNDLAQDVSLSKARMDGKHSNE